MKNILYISIIAILTIFYSCKTNGLNLETTNFTKDSRRGLLVGSITFDSEPKYRFYYIRLTDDATSFQVVIDRKNTGQLDNGKTYLFTAEMPRCKSHVTAIIVNRKEDVNFLLQANTIFSGFYIPYEIKRGQITYLGNIILNESSKEVKLSNKFQQDINELKRMKPNIDWTRVNNDSLRKIEYNNNKVKY